MKHPEKKKKLRKMGICILLLLLLAGLLYFILTRMYARMTFIGHASVKIKTTTREVIYIDPYFPTKFSYIEPADVILLTHDHYDHNNVSLCRQKKNCRVIKWSDALKNGEYQVFELDNIRIEAVPSGGNSNHSIKTNVGYLVTVDDKVVYHSGDTSFAKETRMLCKRKIDYALYTVNGAYTMGPQEATEMADYIGAKVNIPIHGNGKEYWKQRNQFHAKGAKRLIWGQTIFLW